MIRLVIPLKLVSEANSASHAHWRERSRRAKSQRSAVTAAFIDAGHMVRRELKMGPKKAWYVVRLVSPPALPLRVTITRIAPRDLDSDNLAGCGKQVRDQVAELLGLDDRDRRVQWVVDQRRGGVGVYACEVVVEPLEVEARPAPTEVDRG